MNTHATTMARQQMSECGRAHGANWLKWLGNLRIVHGAAGLEIGTFRGDSALWMLQNIFTGAAATYTCIDPFTGSAEHAANGVDCSDNERVAREVLAPFADRCTIIKGYSQDTLPMLGFRKFDFIYVDGDHTAPSVMRDAVMGFELLKVGGIMIFDDYGWKTMPNLLDRPQVAIDYFTHTYTRRLRVLHKGWQVAIKKVE